MKRDLVLIGGGGHAMSCIEVIESLNDFRIAGIIEANDFKSKSVLGYPVIGSDHDLPDLVKEGYLFHIGIGQIKNSTIRRGIFHKLLQYGAEMPAIISPRSVVSKRAYIGRGSVVMPNVIVSVNSKVGENCILNTNVLLEHGVEVGNHTHISTGVIVNGDCKIGDECFVGSGSVFSHQVEIGDKVIVGAGSLVLKNLDSNVIVAGSPCEVKKILQ